MKITEYPELSEIFDDDVTVFDHNGVTKKVKFKTLKDATQSTIKDNPFVLFYKEFVDTSDTYDVYYRVIISIDVDDESGYDSEYLDASTGLKMSIYYKDMGDDIPSWDLQYKRIINVFGNKKLNVYRQSVVAVAQQSLGEVMSLCMNMKYGTSDPSITIEGSKNYLSGKVSLGTSTLKWKEVYAQNGTIQTSDRNEKNSFEDLLMSIVEPFILGLKPMRFKMNSGTSDRFHWGLISQDIEELLEKLKISDLDFAGFIRSPKVRIITEDKNGNPLKEPIEEVIEGEYEYSLRYDEFIAPIIKFIQELYHKYEEHDEQIAILEAENAALKDKVDKAEARIAELETKLDQVLTKLN